MMYASNILKLAEKFNKYADATVSLPPQEVSGISTADLQRVVDNSMMGVSRMDPASEWKVTSQPSGDGYLINLQYRGSVPLQQVQAMVQQVLSLQWPGEDLTLNVTQL